jgi:hypothetical protein
MAAFYISSGSSRIGYGPELTAVGERVAQLLVGVEASPSRTVRNLSTSMRHNRSTIPEGQSTSTSTLPPFGPNPKCGRGSLADR